MKKYIIISLLIIAAGVSIVFLRVPTVPDASENLNTNNENPSGSFEYINTKLGFSFVVHRSLFERDAQKENGGAYFTTTTPFISENDDPHIYETKECALSDSYRLACDIGFEIQKHAPSPGQTVLDTVAPFKGDKIEIDNSEFDFYVKYGDGAGWPLWYTAVPKAISTHYFMIATDPSASPFLEKEILPTFKMK